MKEVGLVAVYLALVGLIVLTAVAVLLHLADLREKRSGQYARAVSQVDAVSLHIKVRECQTRECRVHPVPFHNDPWGNTWTVRCCDKVLEFRSGGEDGALDGRNDVVVEEACRW